MNAVLPVNLGVRSNRIIAPGVLRKRWQIEPNEYDGDLICEHAMWDKIIRSGGLQKICCPVGRKPYAQRPWIAMPAEGRRFKPIGVLNVPDLSDPANVGVDILVPFNTPTGSEIVPTGYDGVITDVVVGITNSQFIEGSGDLTWRISASNRYLRDLGNITTSLGSLTAPNPVPRGGLRVWSENILSITVSFGPNAVDNINAAGRIIVSLTGWYWPQ